MQTATAVWYKFCFSYYKELMKDARPFPTSPIQVQRSNGTTESFFSPTHQVTVQAKENDMFFTPSVKNTIQKQDADQSPSHLHTRRLRQLTPEESATHLERVDAEIAVLEDVDETTLTEDAQAAIQLLRVFYTQGRFQFWEVAPTLTLAAFSRETQPSIILIYLRCNEDGTACQPPSFNSGTLLHEGIHALHQERYRGIDSLYRQYQRGGHVNPDYYRWRVWTEYNTRSEVILYGRRDDLRAPLTITDEEHYNIMRHPEIRELIAELRANTSDTTFDPRSWNPRHYRRRR